MTGARCSAVARRAGEILDVEADGGTVTVVVDDELDIRSVAVDTGG